MASNTTLGPALEHTAGTIFLTSSASETAYHPDSSLSNLHEATLWLQKFLLPLVLVGVFGNVMTMLTVRPFRTRDSSVDLFLSSLAVADFCVLVSSPLVKWVRQQLGFRVLAVHDVVCKVLLWISFASPPLSAWILVAFTAQRAVSVLWPHKVNVLCTRRRSCYVILALVVVLPLLYAHVMYGYAVVVGEGGQGKVCTVASESYARFLAEVFVYYDLVVFTLLPFLCMVSSNGILVWKVTSALKKARATLTSLDKGKERERKVSAITVTAMVVSTSFLVLTLPYLLNNFFFAVELHIAEGDSEEEPIRGTFVSELLYFLANANFALNFYLYCLTGSKFRNQFRRLVTCRGHGGSSNNSSSSSMMAASQTGAIFASSVTGVTCAAEG